MTRYDAIQAITGSVQDEVLVANIGVPSKELYAARDPRRTSTCWAVTRRHPRSALASPQHGRNKKVIVIDGDGSLLGSAILPVIAAAGPKNLTIACLDNGVFGSTGNQPRPGQDTADLALMALGAGFVHSTTVHKPGELEDALASWKSDGPAFIHARIRPGNSDVPDIPLSPSQIRDRFMAALRK